MSLDLTPSLNTFGYNITCFGMQDGYINLTINNGFGPYQIYWSNGASTQNISGLAAGYYRVEVTDLSNGARGSADITLREPEPIFTSVHLFSPNYPNGFNVTCSSCLDGSIATSVESGVSPFLFEWNDGATTQDRASIHAGAYLVTVTGANGCAATAQINLTAPEREDWTAFGNSGSNPGIHFLGTIDDKDLVFKTNSVERLRLKSNGDIKLSGLAGSGTRLLFADQNGIIGSQNIKLPNDVVPVFCDDLNPLVFAFKQSPVVPAYIYSCWQRLGLGTDNPQARLHVLGSALFSWHEDYTRSIDIRHNNHDGEISTTYGHLLLNYYNGKDVVIGGGSSSNGKLVSNGDFIANSDVHINGNVGIGTDPVNNYKLVVDGKIGARELLLAANAWPDYVFEKDYRLHQIEDVYSNLMKSKHLSGLAAACEIENNGIDVSTTISTLTKHIEQLYLYINQLNEKIKQLQK